MTARALVIGGGPNGLAAAIRLAESDLEVTLVEAQDALGGAVRTQELTLPGFRHDTFSAVHPAGAASPVFARLDLARHGLRWVHPAVCSAHPLDGGRSVALHRDLGATARSLDAIEPGDGERWRAWAEPFLDVFPALRDTMLGGFPPLPGAARLLRSGGPAAVARLAALLPRTARGLGRSLLAAPEARAWLYGACAHGDVPPTGAGSAIAGVYLNLLGHAVGWPSPEGGAQALTDALAGALAERGGAARTNARVQRILARGSRVTGVELAGGERLAADVVVADVLPHALARLAGDQLPGAYRALLGRYTHGLATIKVDWALDGPIPWATDELRGAGTVHVGGGEDELLATLAHAGRGLPERPFLLLGQQSVADPTRAPAGRHTAWAYTHGPQAGVDYGAETHRHAERMEAQVERYAPGFRDRILARHVLGPSDLQRRDESLAGGDVAGGSYRLGQLVMRPVPSLSPYRTPLAGLYLGSAATFPGGAVHGVSGDAAARAALADRAHRWLAPLRYT